MRFDFNWFMILALVACPAVWGLQEGEAKQDQAAQAVETQDDEKELTVAENMAFYSTFWNGRPAPEELLEELRLNECRDRQVRYLSAGQRCRAALGCMRLKPAKLWLLDEPLTNLDARGAELVAGWLTAHTTAGGLAIVATHQREQLVQAASVEIEL